jgi:acetylornithine deacetylase/succinyl-diaminopimelate desuccinylase-like protein
MSKVLLDVIAQNEKTYVAELRELLRKPSISAQSIGIRETADWIVQYMESLGMEARIYPVADGHPVVFGELKGETDRSILFYNHYDVQPPEPLELWESEPFSADIRDGKIFSRGVADNKGCLMARLQAVKAILQTRGKLPVSVKFLVEGEEEIGSPHLRTFVDAHRELLRSDLCIWENAYGDEDGNPTIRLGNKGMCYVELSVQSMKSDTHSKNATIYPNAAWEMIWALSTLKDSNENILIEGFYDRVVDPGPEELAVIKRVPIQEEKIKARAGVD